MNMEMDDVKPFQHCLIPPTTTDLKRNTDFPTKTGEIFRHNRGKYSFLCFDCGFIIEDFAEIINHCDSHYPSETFNETEFVVCPDSIFEVTMSSSQPLLPDILETKSELVDRPEGQKSETKPEMNVIKSDQLSAISVEPQNCEASSVGKEKKERQKPGFTGLQCCPICGISCVRSRSHMKKVHGYTHGTRIFQCFMCKKLASNAPTLKRHVIDRHTNTCYQCAMEPPIRNSLEPRRHKCQFCKEWYKNHAEFRVHFKDAHDQNADTFYTKRKNCNVFTCYVCEREFPYRDYLVQHMRRHYDKFLRHTCSICGKTWRTFGLLTQHMKKHDGKIYQCDQCDKQFPNYVRLRVHRKCHDTELKYKCPHCPKAFTQRKYLMIHKVVHDEVKKYQCRFCDARFNFSSGRRAHEKSQHNVL